jgi:hypothetical protein
MQEISNPPLIVYFIYKGNNRQISGRLFGDTMFHYGVKLIDCYHTVPSRFFIVITIVLISLSILYLLNLQVQSYQQMENYCDERFGADNWELNETTGTGVHKYYIGQVWECVAK